MDKTSILLLIFHLLLLLPFFVCFGPGFVIYSETFVNGHIKEDRKLVFNKTLSLSAGQKYCRMLQGEHSAIPLTFVKLPFDI